MSSHGFKGNGGGGDPPRGLPAGQPTGHILPQQMPSELLKAGFQAVKTTLVNRPIAPAPSVGSLGSHPSVAGAQVIAAHNLITKVPAVVGGHLDGGHGNPAGGVKPHGAVTVALTTLSSSSPQAAGPALTLQAPASIQSSGVQMASLIRSGSLPAGSTLTPSGVTTLTPHIPSGGSVQTPANPHMTTISAPLATHAFPSHIPRGAAAAASALSAPKPGTMAAAILRPAPQINYNAQGTAARMQMTAQPRAFLPVRPTAPSTPPVSRPTSPASLQTQEGHRPLVGTTTISSAQTGTVQNTVQITIQQPKSSLPMQIETNPRLLSELRPPKPHLQPLSGPTVPHNPRPSLQQSIQQIPKVIMTTTAALHATTTAHNTATTKLITGQAYSISHNLQRQPKILVSQPQAGATLHPQQVSVPQPALQQNTINSAPAKTLAANITKQKILMSPSSVIAGLQSPTMLSSHAAASPMLNLGHIQRQQKMVVSQVTMAAPALKNTSSVAATSKQGPAVATATNTCPHISPVPVTTATAPVSSLPIAKVPPQRQVSASPQQVTLEVSRPESSAPSTAPGVFLPHGAPHRSSSSPAVPSTTAGVSLPAGFVETRGQERPNVPFSYSNLPNLYGPSLVDYSNPLALQFPQQVAAYAAQALTSLPQATALRGVLPSQTPNLAATLQAATAQSGSTAAATVRLNPMMVTVDPARHPQLPLHSQQFTATSEGGAPIVSHPLASTTMTTVVNPASGGPHPQPAPSPSSNISASPRPSILRKRTNDGVTVVKKNLLGQLSEVATSDLSSSLPLTSPKSSIHDPSRENSQSSTDTATSTESTPQPPTTPELRIKQEPIETSENGSVPPSTPGTPSLPNSIEASPRKKPRKQLLNATQDVKEEVSSEEEDHELSSKDGFPLPLEPGTAIKQEEQLSEYVDDEGIRWVTERKRPNISLLNHYQLTWKPRNNHFLKHTDVKPKEERRPTVNELANQRGIIQKASGWKLYHLAAQMEDMEDMERDINRRILAVQETIAPKHIAKTTVEDDIGMVHELTQGNIQRSRLLVDQLQEARAAMIKVLEHKKRINEIIQKHHSKRPVKKKERT